MPVSSALRERLVQHDSWDATVERALIAFFFHAVDPIHDERIKRVLLQMLEQKIAWQFYIAPASSSKKNHPAWQNERSGLVRHVTEMAIALWRIAQAYPELTTSQAQPTPETMDILLASVILHDAFKGGIPWTDHTVPEHSVLAATAWKEAAAGAWLPPAVIEHVFTAIWWHGGRWTPGWDGNNETLGTRKNLYAQVLHQCDMMFSDTNLNLLFQPTPIPLQSPRKR